MLQPINLKKKLKQIRTKQHNSNNVIYWAKTIFNEVDKQQETVLERLSKSPIQRNLNSFDIDNIATDAIFHIDTIKKLCIDYRLRFLDTKYFKGEYPQEVISKINSIEEVHDTVLDGFKIIAPSKLFTLNEADDPLLFVPMGNDYYYLIHKWGTDLHPLRKLKFLAIKNVENLLIAVLFASLLGTIFFKDLFYGDMTNFGYIAVLFLFFVKGIVGIIFFYGVASGKNFSAYCWQSSYNKIS